MENVDEPEPRRREKEVTPFASDVFRLLVETVRDYAIFVLDPHGHVLSWNAGAERIKGYRADEIIGHFFGVFYSDADRACQHPEHELEQATKHGIYAEEGWRFRKDGTRFWANVVITSLRDPKGALVGFAKVTRDLTDQRQAAEVERRLSEEKTARRTMERLQQVTAAMSHALLPEAAAGVLMREAIAATGAARAGLYVVRRDKLVLFADEDMLPASRELFAEIALAADLPVSRSVRALEPLFFESLAEMTREHASLPPNFEQSGARAIVCLPLVVGERALGVLALTFMTETRFSDEQRTFLTAIADVGAQAFARATVLRKEKLQGERDAFLSEATRVLSSSIDYIATLKVLAKLAVPAFADWCAVEIAGKDGAPSEQIAVAHVDPEKITLAAALHRRYPTDPAAPNGVPNVLRTGRAEHYEVIPDAMLVASCKDEEHLRLIRSLGLRSAIIVPLIARGRVAAAMTLVRAEHELGYDEGDFATAEELARRAGAAIENAELYKEAKDAVAFRDEFLAVASHDLRTPLSTLKLQVQAMLVSAEKKVVDEREHKRLTRLDQEVNRLTELVNKLLDVSRINLGRVRLEPVQFSLAALVTDVVDRYDHEAAKAGCVVTVSSDGEIVGRWDRLRLDQVVTNLLSNALKYGAGKPVDLRLSRVGDRARLTIRDHGIGIAQVDQARVFEKFERAVSGRYYSGVGIGLWICRQIVEAHNGTISVTSAQGNGAEFVVEVPLE